MNGAAIDPWVIAFIVIGTGLIGAIRLNSYLSAAKKNNDSSESGTSDEVGD